VGCNCIYKKWTVSVRESVPGDIIYLKNHLRKEEIEEIWASHASTPEQALLGSYLSSIKCFTLLIGDVPAAMFGIAPDTLLGEKACIWLLGTNMLAKIKKTFMVLSKKFIDAMLGDYPYLYNYVDFRYKKSLQWLQWCGAKISDPVPFGPEQLPFCRIVIRRA
jgi:hypothetical protein